MTKTTTTLAILLALVIGVVGGFLAGVRSGFSQGDAAGYARAEADIKKTQGEIAKRAAEEAANAANPFQAGNPLQGVTANPFDAAAKKLNPFSQ